MRRSRRAAWRWWPALIAMVALVIPARAEEYILGPEDVVQVSVWLHPELDKTLPVGADGNITFAPIGQVKAGGLTAKQLGDRLADRLSSYLRQTTTCTVTITQFLSRSVYVVGAVNRPGRYGFETMPGLVDLLSQAGGAVAGADLSRVQILRREGESRRVINADVATALQSGIGTDLPELKPGDTVVVNTSGGGAYSGGPGDAISIMGEVMKPGLYPAGSGLDLWVLMAQAGGFTPNANLKKVRIITQADQGSQVRVYDLDTAAWISGGKPVLVKPGEVVFVTSRHTNPIWAAFVTILPITLNILNVALAVELLNGNVHR
ncbi:MAG TPA: polysaccharide biosynthesis/export family protein [Candidatus Sulfotelmatobacter sp.]|nr:polysaccharide biosynthesis/export family protein [Candidatus Sulfotelmatobacter sp.]